VAEGRVAAARIDESCARVMTLKRRAGVIP
jgi:hypothetical protein